MKAVWNNVTIAESNDTVIVEHNHYFPANSVHEQYLRASDTHSSCPWKGEASYYHLVVDNQVNEDAAWYYPAPKQGAEQVKDRIAFWNGVEIVE